MRLYTLASGSTGNCTLLIDNRTAVLIDLGISTKRLRLALESLGLSPGELSGVLITHEHGDHICGLTTFIKNYDVPIYTSRTIANHLRWSILGADDSVLELSVGNANAVGALSVVPFRTPHDTPESVGYRITGGTVFGFCTDCGHVSGEVLEGLRGADCAVIEANHDIQMLLDGAYPAYLKRRILSDTGHLSNNHCGELAVKLVENGAKNLVLAHLSRENNTPAIAQSTILKILHENAINTEKDVSVAVAPERDIFSLSLGGSDRGCRAVSEQIESAALERCRKC